MTNQNRAQEFFRLGQEADNDGDKLKFYDKALEIIPDDVDILVEKAEVLENIDDYEALKVYDKALEIEPGNCEILKRKIDIFEYNGEYDKALKVWDKALEVKPNNIKILMDKVRLLSNNGEYDKASKVCDEALEVKPNSIDILMEKAWVLGNSDEYDKALKVYDKALEVKPNNIDVLLRKITFLSNNGEYEKALKVCDATLEVEPNNIDILMEKAWVLGNSGETEKALKVYDKALKIKPDDVKIWIEMSKVIRLTDKMKAYSILYGKGIECLKNNDSTNAFEYFESAAAINSKGADIWIKMGDAKFGLNEYASANRKYNAALNREPKNIEALHKNGKAYEMRRDIKKAEDSYNKALKIDPTYDSSKNFDENASTYTLTNNMNTNHESGTEDFDITSLYFEPKQKGIIISQITTAMKNGKHIILSGPPGTGKSKLAKEICDFHKNDYHMCTATSDWSTFETIGGYRPDEDNKLQFFPGIFLQCFKDNNDKPSNHWLIIDEINRADIDKAFGSLFSALTGDDVVLPFKMSDEFVKIVGKFDEDATYGANHFIIPDDWSIIATMNTFDKSSLYEMSYAFMRRFAFIPIDVPQEINTGMVREYVKCWGVDGINGQICSNLSDLWNLINESRKIGPAIIEDLYKYIERTNDYTSALILFVLPQFEGLMEEEQISFVKKTLKEFGFVNDHNRLKGFVSDFFGIDPREFNSNESDE
jgi:tetratricopeptide (TPR) repeat protein